MAQILAHSVVSAKTVFPGGAGVRVGGRQVWPKPRRSSNPVTKSDDTVLHPAVRGVERARVVEQDGAAPVDLE